MPRTVMSNGIKSEIRALGVIKLNKPVTPQEINTHVGTGDYAAKYISMLSTRYGFQFTTKKDGRRVLSYTLIKEPANAKELRNMQPKPKKTKVKKEKKQKEENVSSKKKTFKKKNVDIVIETFGDSGDIGQIDSSWDQVSHEEMNDIIKAA